MSVKLFPPVVAVEDYCYMLVHPFLPNSLILLLWNFHLNFIYFVQCSIFTWSKFVYFVKCFAIFGAIQIILNTLGVGLQKCHVTFFPVFKVLYSCFCLFLRVKSNFSYNVMSRRGGWVWSNVTEWHMGNGGLKSVKKCDVLLEWALFTSGEPLTVFTTSWQTI